MSFDRPLKLVEAVDEGVVALPFAFITRAASVPDTIRGSIIASGTVTPGVSSLVRTSAGLFTFSITDKPYEIVGGSAVCSSGAAEDIVVHVDDALATTTGVVTVRFMTGTTPTDPATGCRVNGVLFGRKTDRRAGL